MTVKTSATRVHVTAAEKLSSMISPAAVAAQSYKPLFHAVLDHRLATSPADDLPLVAIHQLPTIVIQTMKNAQNVLSLRRRNVHAANRLSRTSLAGEQMRSAVWSVERHSDVARILVERLATSLAIVKMPINIVNKSAAS